MSKRKPAKASKQSRSKVAPKAQRARQAVVRSPKPRPTRTTAARSNEPLPGMLMDSPLEAAVLERPMPALPFVESPAIVSQGASQRTTRDDSTKPFEVFSAAANLGLYQTKLPELAQANMQLAFEFAQRIMQVTSPLEFPSLLSELTRKQFAIFQNFVFARTNIMRQEKDAISRAAGMPSIAG